MPHHHHCRYTRRGRIIFCLLHAAIFLAGHQAASAAEFMFRARVDGKMLEGQPLFWSDAQMLLLGRDGALYEFDPRQAKEGRKTAPRFLGYEMGIMKQQLYEEFGDRFDLTSTQHYLVIHPRGQKDLWAQRFEDLFRAFNRYVRVRGFNPQEPKYPLVAIVFRNESEYYEHAAAVGTPLQPGFLGHYDPRTNRVFLFDLTSERASVDWSLNADTIIHEATHQTAYNVGIHTRFTAPPAWVVEGLATMFEAPGVWNSQSHHSQKDRFNRSRLRDFQNRVAPNWQTGELRPFVATDDAFDRDPTGAYATAWALSFYLCETLPRDYCTYLRVTADRAMFADYTAQERVADFESVFGREWKMLEVKLLRWMAELK